MSTQSALKWTVFQMKLWELSEASPFGPPPGLHLRLTGMGSLQHPQIPN